MKVVVIGANGPTGKLVVQRALAAGHQVRAVTRHPQSFELTGELLDIHRADITDQDQADEAVEGHDAVLSSLGQTYSWRQVTLFSTGTGNVVRAMQRAGVPRLACVSSTLTDPASRYHDTGGGAIFEKVIKRLLATSIGRTSYDDMRKMELLVAASGLDWTIVRAGGLFEAEKVSEYRTAEQVVNAGATSRIDLADLLVRQVQESKWSRKVVAVATVTGAPPMLRIVRNQALR